MLYKDYVERKTANAIRINSAEGYPCVFDNSKGRPLKDYKIYGNSTQDGKPTPDNPVEIQSVGDYTKNLINESAITLSSGYWSDVDGHPLYNKSSYIMISSVKCNPNETYTLSSNLKIYTIWFFNNDTSISKTYRQNMVATFKTPENCNSLRISLVNTSGNTDTIAFKWIQLELGTAATEYEPYHKYDIPIVVRGKNLIKYPYATASRTMNGVKYTVNKDGSVSVVGTATAASYFILNSNVDFGNSSILENSTNGVYATSGGVRYNVSNHTVSINVASGKTVDKIVYPQIEYGTTATEYEPYQGSITEHIYLDEPLRKVGDYADYIDFKNKKVVRNVVQGVLNGSESWSSSGTRYCYYNTKLNIKCLGTSVAGIKSNALPSVPWDWIGNSGTGIATYSDNRIDIRANGVWSTVDEAKAYMRQNPISYIAPCLVPTEEDISLPALKALKGTNIISVATEIEPSYIEVKYIAK